MDGCVDGRMDGGYGSLLMLMLFLLLLLVGRFMDLWNGWVDGRVR